MYYSWDSIPFTRTNLWRIFRKIISVFRCWNEANIFAFIFNIFVQCFNYISKQVFAWIRLWLPDLVSNKEKFSNPYQDILLIWFYPVGAPHEFKQYIVSFTVVRNELTFLFNYCSWSLQDRDLVTEFAKIYYWLTRQSW